MKPNSDKWPLPLETVNFEKLRGLKSQDIYAWICAQAGCSKEGFKRWIAVRDAFAEAVIEDIKRSEA